MGAAISVPILEAWRLEIKGVKLAEILDIPIVGFFVRGTLMRAKEIIVVVRYEIVTPRDRGPVLISRFATAMRRGGG